MKMATARSEVDAPVAKHAGCRHPLDRRPHALRGREAEPAALLGFEADIEIDARLLAYTGPDHTLRSRRWIPKLSGTTSSPIPAMTGLGLIQLPSGDRRCPYAASSPQ